MALALKVPVGKTTSRVGEAEASRAVGVLREPTPRGIDWAQIRAELVEPDVAAPATRAEPEMLFIFAD